MWVREEVANSCCASVFVLWIALRGSWAHDASLEDVPNVDKYPLRYFILSLLMRL